MVTIRSINIEPPLINTSCAWASDLSQLQELYDCPHTGAVTTRTATLDGFTETEEHTVRQQVVFTIDGTTSLNSYGYSPHPLSSYLSWIRTILSQPSASNKSKPFIISITSSSPPELTKMVQFIQQFRSSLPTTPYSLIAIELNTSCPNIPTKPPPAYNPPTLLPLLTVLAEAVSKDESLTVGLKLAPFLYRAQFVDLLECISSTLPNSPSSKSPFAFFTCTNTLGNSLLLPSLAPPSPTALPSFSLPTPLGGLAGASLHPLALGNVYTFTQLLSSYPHLSLKEIVVIGVGGVRDEEGVRRMRKVGARVVGCASAFGMEGVAVFGRLVGGLDD
ncbi:hypothetical protein JAAARDRAFT_209114 [Jaapia argillacea MUCL 33604]|uniref:Dihydroorotate oxidase n=1 Tax=Jaapia argillacea MUCL 33604 TaxID=933084 RepID=A0A067PJ60_9AGAM|nr:hypothetical protein JAAARDRAFT_209114 [Jaapia argillacea MUCL 33604]